MPFACLASAVDHSTYNDQQACVLHLTQESSSPRCDVTKLHTKISEGTEPTASRHTWCAWERSLLVTLTSPVCSRLPLAAPCRSHSDRSAAGNLINAKPQKTYHALREPDLRDCGLKSPRHQYFAYFVVPNTGTGCQVPTKEDSSSLSERKTLRSRKHMKHVRRKTVNCSGPRSVSQMRRDWSSHTRNGADLNGAAHQAPSLLRKLGSLCRLQGVKKHQVPAMQTEIS